MATNPHATRTQNAYFFTVYFNYLIYNVLKNEINVLKQAFS